MFPALISAVLNRFEVDLFSLEPTNVSKNLFDQSTIQRSLGQLTRKPQHDEQEIFEDASTDAASASQSSSSAALVTLEDIMALLTNIKTTQDAMDPRLMRLEDHILARAGEPSQAPASTSEMAALEHSSSSRSSADEDESPYISSSMDEDEDVRAHAEERTKLKNHR